MELGKSDTYNISTFYDGFGNVIQVKRDAEDSSKQIVVDTFYDNLTRVMKQTNPYLTTLSSSYTTPDSNENATKYTYDPIDRIKRIINPDNTEKEFVYDHWNTTAYDEKDNRIDYYFDAYGRITNITEHNNGDKYITNYKYIPTGELVIINDSEGNIFNFTYDSLGRKIQSNDLDLGQWNYSYDKVGNLIEQTDARGIKTEMKYDQLNRVTEKNASSINVSYTYDLSKNNTLSQVIISDSLSNTTVNYTYDDRLRNIEERKLVNNNLFITNNTYNPTDKILSKITPDKTIINNTYNNQNLLGSIKGIINITYNEFDKPKNKTFFNGLNTNYTYDLKIRLTRITTNEIQKLNYTYDSVSNILNITNFINSTTESMTYDNLNRLLTSIKINSSAGFIFNITYLYNKIGNMINISSAERNISFYYEQGPKHAPSKLDDTLQSSAKPVVSNLILNASDNPYNNSDANLTAYWTITSSKNVKNITNWYLNNNSVTGLNLPFEGGSNTTYTRDYSGYNNNNNGNVNGVYWNSTGGYDRFGAYQFDGIDDYIKIENSPSINFTTQPFSLEAWIYKKGDGNSDVAYTIISKAFKDLLPEHISYALVIFGTNYSSVGNDTGFVISNGANLYGSNGGYIANNQWYHIVGTWNGTKTRIYVNGVLKNSDNANIIVNPTNIPLTIGGLNDSDPIHLNTAFNGTIDDARIWNRSLSAEEVKFLFNNRTDMLSSAETNENDIWHVAVTADDGTQNSETVNSSYLQIKPRLYVTNVILNASDNPNNTTNANLTANFNVVNADSTNVKNITNWYLNNKSIMLLNIPFEGGSNKTYIRDYSGLNPVSVINATWCSNCGHDGFGAYNFSGVGSDTSNGYINTTNKLIITKNVSVSVWVNLITPTFGGVIYEPNYFGGGEGAIFYDTSMQPLCIDFSGVNTITGTAMQESEWYNIICIWNDTKACMYLNGGLEGCVNNDADPPSPSTMSIGSDDGWNYHTAGIIDDLIIWNRTLSAEEIKLIFENKTNMLSSQETNIWDIWQANVTVNDGIIDSNPVESNYLKIL